MRAHVGTLRLAVHEDIQAHALLLVVCVLHVVVDHLLVLLSAQLALLELQPGAAQLCTGAQQRRFRGALVSQKRWASHSLPTVKRARICTALHTRLLMHARSTAQLVATYALDIAPQITGFWRSNIGSAKSRGAPGVWGKEPMVVVGKSGVWIWLVRRVLKS